MYKFFYCPLILLFIFEKLRNYIFHGYAKDVKGYKLWELVSRKKIISNDIIFDKAYMLKNNEIELSTRKTKRKRESWR